MRRYKLLFVFVLIVVPVVAGVASIIGGESPRETIDNIVGNVYKDEDSRDEEDKGESIEDKPHSLSIEYLREGEYPGSDIVIEQTFDPGVNYQRYIASYRSEGLKINALLTVPNGDPPSSGWPVVVFNHGYIPPSEYRTTERYIAYTDAFSRNGYIVFRPDYRGHGNSEGVARGAYGSPDYTIDVLNAVSSIKKYEDADPKRIGMWGHSMGGYITLRAMVTNNDVRAGVIWAGVVGNYDDMMNNWRRNRPTPIGGFNPSAGPRRSWRQSLTEIYGSPKENPDFWNSISANSYLSDISGPIQLHHGTNDEEVPVEFSEKLDDQLDDMGKISVFYEYPGDDHNISGNLYTALQRSVEFFDEYVKEGGEN